MAVDVAVSPAESEVRPVRLARVAAVPAWVWLAGIVGASIGGRFLAALGRVAPYYLPDEYIYPSLARSFAEHGRPMIRGVGVHFPALLEPLVTAPVWFATSNPWTAWRVTQGIHVVVFSLAAVPAYLLARRLALPKWLALGVAAMAVAVPDGVYASSMLSDPLAYPLCLGALCAGVYLCADATWRTQVAFVALTAAAVLARIQFAVIPVAIVAGALAADRFRPHLTVKRLWPSLLALVVPPVTLYVALGRARLLGPYAHGRHSLRPLAIGHWVARDAMLLVYSSGWVILPGALIGLAYALTRPRTRAEIGFAVISIVLAAALLLEAAQIADTDSQRFQERYLFVLLPLIAVAFGLWVQRGFRRAPLVAVGAAALLALAARVPLSGYAAAHNKDDSPTLWAVLRLESVVGTGNGALAVALVAAALSVVAVLIAWRRRFAAVAIVAAIAACCALSAGASSFDSRMSHSMRGSLPSDVRWIDDAHVGAVDLLAPPGSRKEQSWEELFWNRSVHRLLLLGTPTIDQFASGRVRVARDGRLVVNGVTVRRPLVVQTYASTLEFTGMRRVRHELIFDLYRPTGVPRLRLIAAGRFADRWLAPRGAITVWSKHGGTLRLELSLPRQTETTKMVFGARTIVVRPTHHLRVTFAVPRGGAWTLSFHTNRPGYLSDDRAVSVVADSVSFRGR